MAGEEAGGDDVLCLVRRAGTRDRWFARVLPEAGLLARGWRPGDATGCGPFLEAMREIRLLAGARTEALLGFSSQPRETHPILAQFVVHSTTLERACSIFQHAAVYSFNQRVVRGLLRGPALGVRHLLDPKRWLDSVMFHLPDHRFHAGEKVANSQRRGRVDEGLSEDYQPGARLFFRRDRLCELPGQEEDGVHKLIVRSQVRLELLAYAVFPDAGVMQAALGAVAEEERRARLRARCLVVPAEPVRDPETYVRTTNRLVLDLEGRRSHTLVGTAAA